MKNFDLESALSILLFPSRRSLTGSFKLLPNDGKDACADVVDAMYQFMVVDNAIDWDSSFSSSKRLNYKSNVLESSMLNVTVPQD